MVIGLLSKSLKCRGQLCQTILFLFFALSFTSTAWSDNSTGMNAYNRGDYSTALKQWESAAEAGDHKAQNNLASMYYEGNGIKQDYQRANYWYQRSAEQGNPIAQFSLGYSYANGLGLLKDLEKALYWYKKAANQGNATAAFNMGVVYEKEKLVRDYDIALQWYHVATDRCSIKALVNIGAMYNQGLGVSQDKKEALRWNQQAAKFGDKNGQYKVGLRYWDNEFIPQNFVQAYFWLSLAGQQDETHGFALRDLVSKNMAPSQIEKAEKLLKSWKPEKCLPK